MGHDLKVSGTQATIRFARPIEASFAGVQRTLRTYVAAVEAGSDGRSVRITLHGNVEAYSYDSGSAVIVEVAGLEGGPQPAPAAESASEEPAAAAPKTAPASAPAPAPAPPPAADLPRVGVRTGVHADYTRIVFDWEEKVDYAFSEEGGVVKMRFASPADVNISRLSSRPPSRVGGAQSRITGDSVWVAFSVPETSTVRHFLSGSKVVVDIRSPGDAVNPVAMPADPLAEVVAVAPAAPPEASEPAAPSETPPEPAPPTADAEAATGGAESQTAASEAASPETQSPEAAGAPEPAESTEAAAADTGGETGEAAAQAETGPASAPTDLTPSSQAASDQAGGAPQAAAEAAKVSATTGEGDEGGVTLRFDWDEPVAAAVFRRVGKLWIAFDKATTIDPAALAAAGGDFIRTVEQLPGTGGTIMRIETMPDVNPVLRRDGLSWLLSFQKRELEANTPLDVDAQPDSPVGARVFIPVPEPGVPLGVTDPDVGDNLVIVPIIPLGHGVVRPRLYPELRVLPSGQGVVVQALIDNLRVRPLRQGIELASSQPLSLSSVSAEVAAGSKLGSLGPVSRILDLEKWGAKTPEDFMRLKRELQRELAFARPSQQETARLNLARFYFANAYAAEALGVLRRLVETAPEVEETAEFRLLRGGSSFLMHRLTDAAEDFAHSSLDESDEGSFWRAVVIAETGELIAAAHELRRTGSITQPYPLPLRLPLATLVADAVVEIGDIQQGQQYIEALMLTKPNRRARAKLLLIEGKLLELGGDDEGAIAKWEEVREIDSRPTRARSTVSLMEKLLTLERAEVSEVIDEFEKLRFAWRGGAFEFDLLRRLGGFYLQTSDYRKGLIALRQAATYFRENEAAPEITQQMSDTFNFLYLEEGADVLAPVTAIAVYEEFKELTPAGRKGDEMIRKLADRLVRVDLLDQAANLLDGQIQFRLQGVERAQVGTNLSLIHAIAGEFDKVLEVLEGTEVPGIPDRLAERRRHLRARALMGVERNDEALFLLKKDKSLDADLIRAELFWAAGDWPNASQSLRNVVRGAGLKPGQPLDREGAIRILNLATAYTLSGNERASHRLRQDYAAAMAATEYADAFALVTAPVTVGMIDPGSIGDRVKLATSFKSFLNKYKEQLEEGELSSFARTYDTENEPVGDVDDAES